jgi:hypothetical protein
MVAMHGTILVLFLALLVPHAIAQSISFLPLPNHSESSNITFPQATHYDLYKNSGFTANCSFRSPTDPDDDDDDDAADPTSGVQTMFARSQSDFCAKLNSTIPWFVWPTQPTNAAYLPNWVAVSFTLVVLFAKGSEIVVQRERRFGKLAWTILVYDVGQSVVWWYNTISGFTVPLNASWVDPTQWLTPASYVFLIWTAMKAGEDPTWCKRFWAVLPFIFLAALTCLAGMAYAIYHYYGDLGTGSYTPLTPFPVLPQNITSTCGNLLQNLTSPLYSDPNWQDGGTSQVFLAGAMASVIGAWVLISFVDLCCCCTLNAKHYVALITCAWGIILHFVVLFWLSAIAAQGVPLMLHEKCGVIVIAMSPARGYYDSELHYGGLKLQALRSVFGICKSLFLKRGISFKLTTQLRASIYQITTLCLHWLMVFAFILWISSQVSV